MFKHNGREIGDYELCVDYSDAPDFTDSFMESGEWADGTTMTDKELDEINDDQMLIYSMVESEVY